jgi:uncharacterized HhH-GPD family protein
MPSRVLRLTGDPRADRLLAEDPFALVVGMLLDQQFPMERAFASPAELARRLGTERLDPGRLAAMNPERLAELFSARPALHRYPGSMAQRVQALSRMVTDHLGGDTARLWREPRTGEELVRRLEALPGFGTRKAKIFGALLGKQLGVRPRGWRQATAPYGEEDTRLSIADVVSPETLAEVRETKQAAKRAAKAADREARAPTKSSRAARAS